MQLGLASAILPDLSFDDVIQICAREQLNCVELMCWPKGRAERRYAGVTHLDLDQLDNELIQKTRQALDAQAIQISALGYYPNPLDPDPAVRETVADHLRKLIHSAALLGVGTITTFIGRDPWKTYADNLALFEQVWPDLIRYAESQHVRVAIENCPMLFTQDEWPGGKNLATTPARWRDLFDRIPSPNFGLNFDPSHFIWQQMDYIQPLYDFADRLFHVHIKDARINRERLNQVGILATPLEFQSPKLPGLGDVDWAHFFSALNDIGYHGAAVLEIEDKAFEASLNGRLAAISQANRYIRQFVTPF